jgi:hypothetical protein
MAQTAGSQLLFPGWLLAVPFSDHCLPDSRGSHRCSPCIFSRPSPLLCARMRHPCWSLSMGITGLRVRDCRVSHCGSAEDQSHTQFHSCAWCFAPNAVSPEVPQLRCKGSWMEHLAFFTHNAFIVAWVTAENPLKPGFIVIASLNPLRCIWS